MNMRILLTVILIVQSTLIPAKESCQFDHFACDLTTISWVEVVLSEHLIDRLTQYKDQYEKLIRVRLKNDLSELRQEVISPDKIYEIYSRDNKQQLNKRGLFVCMISTAGDEVFPIALNIECSLKSYFSQCVIGYDEFVSYYLGITSSDKLHKDINQAIRDSIIEIAAQFYKIKDSLTTHQ